MCNVLLYLSLRLTLEMKHTYINYKLNGMIICLEINFYSGNGFYTQADLGDIVWAQQ